jgi:hypothetical protein
MGSETDFTQVIIERTDTLNRENSILESTSGIGNGLGTAEAAVTAKPARPAPEKSGPKEGQETPRPSSFMPGLGHKVDIRHDKANFPYLHPLGARSERSFDLLG